MGRDCYKNKMVTPIEFIASLIISPKWQDLALVRSYLYGLLTMAMLAGLLMGIRAPARYETGEWKNHKFLLFLSKSLLHNSSFMVVDTAL